MTHRMVPGKEWCHRHRKGRQADSHQGAHTGNFTSSYNEADFKSELKKSADLALGELGGLEEIVPALKETAWQTSPWRYSIDAVV